MKQTKRLAVLVLSVALSAQGSIAQTPARDPSARLREVLPADVAQRVLARIADARARQLPAEALENRALKFAAKGVAPKDIERSVNEQVDRMSKAQSAIETGRALKPRGDEIEAGAEAIRKGVSGESISNLAKSAPSGRSLAVPLFVIGSLKDRGLSSDQAVKRVLDRLAARASDVELEAISGESGTRGGGAQGSEQSQSGGDGNDRPAMSGKPGAAGPPAGVPGNAGTKANPRRPKH